MKKTVPAPISTDFDDRQEQLTFDSILECYVGGIEARDSDESRKHKSHITQFYSQLPKRVPRSPKDGKSVVTRNFVTGSGETIKMAIKPAIIFDKKTSETLLIYPKTLEDRVEDALAYIAAQGAAKRMPEKRGIGVRFSIRLLQTTIKHLFGKSYRRDKILTALEVLASTTIDIKIDGLKNDHSEWSIQQKQIHRITGLTLATKNGEDNTECFCWLNAWFVSEIIDGSYTVHDLRWQAELNNDLAEELFKKLSLNYRNASTDQTYNFDARLFLENTCYGIKKTSWTDLDHALKALIEHDVIVEYQEKTELQYATNGRPKIINKIITVQASEKFISAIKFGHYAKKKGKEAQLNYWKSAITKKG